MAKKFRVYGVMTASVPMGEFEAETADEAIRKAYEAGEYHASLCHQCAGHVDLGDIYEEQVEEI